MNETKRCVGSFTLRYLSPSRSAQVLMKVEDEFYWISVEVDISLAVAPAPVREVTL